MRFAVRLTRFTDNALRTLTLLALHPDADVTVSEIARRMRMSEDHVFKVVQLLAAGGYVETKRGRSGGVRLAQPAAKIRIGAVVRHTEESFALVECFTPETNQCPIAPACVLAKTLDRALAAFLAVLDEVTLAELIVQPRRLERLLSA
jgi:Rrf2 family nitric oxide-sensitive transcriptional repressor